MPGKIREGDCVRIPDGRIARVREISAGRCRVRVRRLTSVSHQFLLFRTQELQRVDCPGGWMSPDGYNRYLRATLAKMRERLSKQAIGVRTQKKQRRHRHGQRDPGTDREAGL